MEAVIRPGQVYWSARQSKMAVVFEVGRSGAVKVVTFQLMAVGSSLKHLTWKNGIAPGWTLQKDVR
jgi:hypothetical protein